MLKKFIRVGKKKLHAYTNSSIKLYLFGIDIKFDTNKSSKVEKNKK